MCIELHDKVVLPLLLLSSDLLTHVIKMFTFVSDPHPQKAYGRNEDFLTTLENCYSLLTPCFVKLFLECQLISKLHPP